jgi:hypothetical protein
MGKSFIMRMFIKDEVLRGTKKNYALIVSTKALINEEGKGLQSAESYVMMRKFGLILLRDIMEKRGSLVHREFASLLTAEDEAHIRSSFKKSDTIPDDDINTSVDQTKKLIVAIAKNNLTYPPRPDGKFHYSDIVAFLDELSEIFDWPKYEKATLGKPSLRRWYAAILSQWMSGLDLVLS